MAKKREKLNIKCDDVKCDAGEHSFTQKKRRNRERPPPTCCKVCGEAPVDWEIVRARDPASLDVVISSFRKERIRAFFWNYDLSYLSKQHALTIGKQRMVQRVRARLREAIASARHFRDGQQTPLLQDDDPIHYAQHATATCCRKCVFCWHGIPEGRPLQVDELEYLEAVVWRYLDEKLPELNQPPLYEQRELDIQV